jgi:hypothetical protein
MSADLQIHVFGGVADEADLARFQSHTMGSKYFNPSVYEPYDPDLYDRMTRTPSVWVGEVSWLKAALLGDAKRYVPNTVGAISEIIGEDLPVIDEALIARVGRAFKKSNKTGYHVSQAGPVLDFLREHMGERAFTISW